MYIFAYVFFLYVELARSKICLKTYNYKLWVKVSIFKNIRTLNTNLKNVNVKNIDFI